MLKRPFFLTILPLSIIVVLSGFFYENPPRTTPKNRLSDSTETGKRLALQYCSTCHLFPEPDLLDKNTWVTNVLPNMGWRLGVKIEGKSPYADMSAEEEKTTRELAIYPETPLLSASDWLEIVKYYEKKAPSVLESKNAPLSILSEIEGFKPQFLTVFSKKVPKTTLLKFNPKTTELYIGDAQNELYIMDSLFHLTQTIKTESPPVDVNFRDKQPHHVLTIGSIRPSDQKKGQLWTLDSTKKNLLNQLQRPVHFATGDLNKDGKEDVVVSQFGNNQGKLTWFDGFDATKERVLKPLPGARKVEIRDMNGDKKPDIVALMSQAYEEVTIFYNQGKGKFKEKTVLQFSPVYGVSYFDLVDFNKDGFPDILLTNGDNWDYSTIKKPYHGIRIYLNDGKNNFQETYFFPFDGASKALARDFDQDGDLDIAAIAFFGEAEQGFVYLKNEGNFNFQPAMLPEAALGHWLTLETGDFDHDGDEDIVLCSYFHTVMEVSKMMLQGVQKFPQMLVLKNNRR